MHIGIFGGSFDPIHIGHLLAARDALETLGLDRVLFVPAHASPFKVSAGHAPDAHRLAMVELALSPLPWAEASGLELRREGASFTIDTIRELQALHPEHHYRLLIGMDNLETLHKWRDIDDLLARLPVHTLARPGWTAPDTLSLPPDLCTRLRADIVETRELDISSSEIRKRVAEGKPINYLVPDDVRRYIARYDLYRT